MPSPIKLVNFKFFHGTTDATNINSIGIQVLCNICNFTDAHLKLLYIGNITPRSRKCQS